jgi:hypothetical protein
MSMDDRAIRLLEEIRDQQREHLELYRAAVRRQEESIRMQEEAIGLQRRVIRRIIPAILVLAVLLLWLVIFVM